MSLQPVVDRNRLRHRLFWASGLPVIVLLATSPALAGSAGYMTAGFQTLETRPLSLAVLPPQAEFYKAQAVMTNEMLSEAAALEREAAGSIHGLLGGRGYAVRLVTRAEIEAIPGAVDLLLRFDQRFNEELGKVFKAPKDVRKGRFGVGEPATELARALKVDGLVATRVVAVGNTGGRAALVAALSLGSAFVQSYSKMFLGIVSGNGGRIEGYFPGYVTNGLKRMVEQPDKAMSELAGATLGPFPSAHEKLKPKKKDLEAEAASPDPAQVGDEIIEKFEAAAGSALDGKDLGMTEAGTGAEPPAGDPPPADAPPAEEPPPAQEPPPEQDPPPPADAPPPSRREPPPAPDEPAPVIKDPPPAADGMPR